MKRVERINLNSLSTVALKNWELQRGVENRGTLADDMAGVFLCETDINATHLVVARIAKMLAPDAKIMAIRLKEALKEPCSIYLVGLDEPVNILGLIRMHKGLEKLVIFDGESLWSEAMLKSLPATFHTIDVVTTHPLESFLRKPALKRDLWTILKPPGN